MTKLIAQSSGIEFNHETDHFWQDISSEIWREYTFLGGKIRIETPQFLAVSSTGGHRIFDGRRSHYIPAGWIHLEWEVFVNAPNFVK